MESLHVFDMDGTLLRGTTASMEVARLTGHQHELHELEMRFALREIDAYHFAEAIHKMWHGLTPDMVAQAFASSPWLLGIKEVCSAIRSSGGRSAVITLSPDFFATRLLELGFDYVVASRFPPLPFAEPVDHLGILNPIDKISIVDDLCARHSIPRSRCVAYGDSLSDEPLFRCLSATVAVNPKDDLARIARVVYYGDDLAEAYAIAISLMDAKYTGSANEINLTRPSENNSATSNGGKS